MDDQQIAGGKRARDERWEALKRRIQMLARLEGAPVALDAGLHLVDVLAVSDATKVIARLRAHGVLDRATVDAALTVDRPPLALTTALLATANRDVRVLDEKAARALVREHRRTLARYGTIDEAWLKRKRDRIAALSDVLRAARPRTKEQWFEGVLELVRAVHGDTSATRLAEARDRLTALGAERRRRATARIEILARAIERGTMVADPELAALAQRLERARQLPGRARRTRVLDLLRKAVAWAEAPASAVQIVAAPLGEASFVEVFRAAGRNVVAAMPTGRDPEAREKVLDVLAFYGLLFRIGDDGIPILSTEDVTRALAKRETAAEIADHDLTVAQALALVDLPGQKHPRRQLAGFVASGLELELVAKTASVNKLYDLARCASVRAARAYATWVTRLVPHYKALGIDLALPPELFAQLPKNEDLAVLAACLVQHVKDDETRDPTAVLDATLGLFQKLPGKANGVLARLRGTTPGAARRLDPELAEWLGDDEALDRYVHVARLAGESGAPTKGMREDFEHEAKSRGEVAHLESLGSRSARQEARLAVLRQGDRTAAAAPRGRTKRRVQEAIDRLLPIAWRRELDLAFRDIIHEAWGLSVPSLTPAWRDAVRFWLVVDDNRDMLGRLLKLAGAEPGRSVKLREPKNREWLEKVKAEIDVEAWLRPRREDFAAGGQTYTIVVEQDPLEVLRMGIPFGTCLALDDGCNAASTVVNALDANKQVIYVRTREGKVVARKLLTISKRLELLGYNLYISASGPEEREIRAAVDRMCRAIAEEARLPLSTSGAPEGILGGFWYDDGTVPFESDADVAAYCASLGLAPPPKWYDSIATEARAWSAMRSGDVDTALAHLTRWNRGPANAELGRWIIERLGEREAERRAKDDSSLVPALLSWLAASEDGLVKAIAAATRIDEQAAAQTLVTILARFPASIRAARALADLALRAVRVAPRSTDYGLAHMTFAELPLQLVGTVTEIFDVLDRITPAWEHVATIAGRCRGCMHDAESASAARAVSAYAATPDPDAVIACLTSRRRSEGAQKAALRIAARWKLPRGQGAIARLARTRPNVRTLTDWALAYVTQHEVTRIDDAVIEELGGTARPPFEAFGERIFELEGFDRLVAKWPTVSPIEQWNPGPWELAWYRRHPSPTLRAALRSVAVAIGGHPSRATELLALLADVDALRSIPPGLGKPKHTPFATAKSITTREEQARVAASLVEQVRAADAGKLVPIGDIRHVDRRLAALALATPDAPDALPILLVADAGVSWSYVALRAGEDTAKRLLEGRVNGIPSALAVQLWQRKELRKELAGALARTQANEWSARAWACERIAEKKGLDVDGLFEAWALALLERSAASALAETETLDQLRTVIRLAVTVAAPVHAASLYDALVDEASVSLFVRAVARAPRDRAAALREACLKLNQTGARRVARRAWIEATRLQKSPRSGSRRE